MSLEAGFRLGPYEVRSLLGAGGMGEVYRATDIRLGRDVAIKVLPAALAHDPERLARFEREAKVLATLNHPNIAAVYGLEESQGIPALAMELAEGRTLAERVSDSAIPIQDALAIAKQIADALRYAHGKGIIHRDLKPSNVMVDDAGIVKLLDFGLARLDPIVDDGSSTVAAGVQTIRGEVLGTPSYMSPEQVKGAAVDARSDIFCFGAVLYEMVSGRQAFGGETATARLAAVLSEEPAPLEPPGTEVGRIITKALAKKPEARYQRMEEVTADLTAAQQRLSMGPLRARRLLGAVAAGLLLALVGAGVYWGWRRLAGGPSFDSVAVLPLRNLSTDAEQEWFSEGMTMTMITELSRVRTLKVISPTSVMRYKNTKMPLKDIARELGVQAVVEASVLRAGDRIRVTAQLIDASTERLLWADDYDREMKDVLSLHREIARAVAREVQASLSAGEQQQLQLARAVSPQTMEAYLRGVYHLNRIEAVKAQQFAEEAIRLDPEFAPAHDLLANTLVTRADTAGALYADLAPRARAAAARALELEPNRPGALATLGWITMIVDHQWEQAEPMLRRASQDPPSNGSNYCILLAWQGRNQEAIEVARRELRRDPMNASMLMSLARTQDISGRSLEAIDTYKKVIDLDAGAGYARYHLPVAYLKLGRPEEAFQAWLDYRKPRFKTTEDPAKAQYQNGGWPAVWRLALQEMADRPATPSILHQRLRADIFLGDTRGALDQLEMMEKLSDWWVFLLEDPLYDSLRGEARFQGLLKRLRYPGH